MNYREMTLKDVARVRETRAPMNAIPGKYSVVRGYVGASNRVMFWNLIDPHGIRVAEIRAKRGAIQIAEALNSNANASS